jgi:glutathione synthase/RimK-type ligase-like ATP-grasp enzyme
MILLCGIPTETPLASVQQRLEDMGISWVFLDQRRLTETEISFEVSGSHVTGDLTIGDKRYSLENFIGVYNRLMDIDLRRPAYEREGDVAELLHCRSVYKTLLSWLEVAPARVVNRSSAMGSNFSKPYQSQLIRAQGFDVPETLITNDPELVREFWSEHGQVIYKSVSSVRSIVRLLREDDLDRLDDILWCPTQFQAFVEGINVRVHTVGQVVYASAIVTDATDYRYAYRHGNSIELYEIELPKEVAEHCVTLAESLELPFAGIDIKVTAQNRVYCLEVNPSPAFSYYEEQTGQPIGRTLALYLNRLEGGT